MPLSPFQPDPPSLPQGKGMFAAALPAELLSLLGAGEVITQSSFRLVF